MFSEFVGERPGAKLLESLYLGRQVFHPEVEVHSILALLDFRNPGSDGVL
ncbi:hypothetical protein GCM10009630_31650 [Kribbella jejuensis]